MITHLKKRLECSLILKFSHCSVNHTSWKLIMGITGDSILLVEEVATKQLLWKSYNDILSMTLSFPMIIAIRQWSTSVLLKLSLDQILELFVVLSIGISQWSFFELDVSGLSLFFFLPKCWSYVDWCLQIHMFHYWSTSITK